MDSGEKKMCKVHAKKNDDDKNINDHGQILIRKTQGNSKIKSDQCKLR